MDDERRIEEVVARYVRAVDHRDPATMADIFIDDALVEIFCYGEGELEPLGQVQGADNIGKAVAGLMAPHPPRGWSHHTTLNPIIAVTGDTATYDAQFLVYNVLADKRPDEGWPAGASGAQGAITPPIESGYWYTTLARTDGHWKIAKHIIKHDLPYAFPAAGSA
jgi:ketosteroid isomerase-like protein